MCTNPVLTAYFPSLPFGKHSYLWYLIEKTYLCTHFRKAFNETYRQFLCKFSYLCKYRPAQLSLTLVSPGWVLVSFSSCHCVHLSLACDRSLGKVQLWTGPRVRAGGFVEIRWSLIPANMLVNFCWQIQIHFSV